VTPTICGIDVSSTALDVAIRGRPSLARRFANSVAGVAELACFCREHGVGLAVMEASGGYEQRPFAQLWAEGIAAAIVNPRSVRRFAQGMGLLEKTDRIDAAVIAWYAETKAITAQPPASQSQQQLTAWVTRLRQLTAMRVAQANQARLVQDGMLRGGFDALIGMLDGQIRCLEQAITELLAADPLWARLAAEFRTIKGVAKRTIARLMADLPEIGTLSNKAVAKLTGLAPIANDSGKRQGPRPVRGGRESIRSILFVIAHGVARYDPDFHAFQARLKAAGKPPKVVRVALAHKLLTRLNAKARDVRSAWVHEPA
jgi:transposase